MNLSGNRGGQAMLRANTSQVDNKLTKNFFKYKYFYLMVMPVIIWYIVFCYIPMYGIIIAFQNYDLNVGFWRSDFVGFENFITLFSDEGFWAALKNTVIISTYRLVFEFTAPIVLAIMLNEVRSDRFRKLTQTVIYIPHFLSWVIVASIILTIFNSQNGVVTNIYQLLGKEAPQIMVDPNAFRPLLVISNLWKEVGWNTIIYIAAIAGIDPTLYEGASIDGCNRWQKIRHITLPSIKNIISIMLILSMGAILNAGFDQIFNLYNPMVYSKGDIIDTYVFRNAMEDAQLSLSAAAGIFKSLVSFILIYISNKLTKAIGEEGIY